MKDRQEKYARASLRLILVLLILRQIASLHRVLDRMSTTGKKFPLQSFLDNFESILNLSTKFWQIILTQTVDYHLFENYLWGGFTYAAITWAIMQFLNNTNLTFAQNQDLDRNRGLILVYMGVFILTLLYGLNRDQWVPYVQEPSWEINLVHKQQISAGTFLIIYFVIFILSYLPENKGHQGAILFLSKPKLVTYTFVLMNLDNLASFSWFPGPIDPTNQYIDGYEEIFQEGQSWTSTDKLYHFSMSSVAIVILLMFIKETDKAILVAVSVAIFWELFEIALNPRESSDSIFDMVINSSSILLSAFIYRLSDTSRSDNV